MSADMEIERFHPGEGRAPWSMAMARWSDFKAVDVELTGRDRDGAERYVNDSRAGGSTFADGITLQFGPDTSPAVAYVVSATVAAFHEAMEWFDTGAEPHPDDEETSWDWLTEQMTRVLTDYTARWPKETDHEDR